MWTRIKSRLLLKLNKTCRLIMHCWLEDYFSLELIQKEIERMVRKLLEMSTLRMTSLSCKWVVKNHLLSFLNHHHLELSHQVVKLNWRLQKSIVYRIYYSQLWHTITDVDGIQLSVGTRSL